MENTPKSTQNPPNLTPQTRICEECGKEYSMLSKSHASRYCNTKCRGRAYVRKRKERVKQKQIEYQKTITKQQ